jgi:hypothetical protein
MARSRVGARHLRIQRTASDRHCSGMLAQVFAFGATEVLGETPLKLPQAMGFAAKLGFEPYRRGLTDRWGGMIDRWGG